jgi:hypothetical protein
VVTLVGANKHFCHRFRLYHLSSEAKERQQHAQRLRSGTDGEEERKIGKATDRRGPYVGERKEREEASGLLG